MPQTTINRRCGCKGSDEGVWVVHCGASVVKPGDCKVTTDCKGTCSPTGKFKPSKDMKPTIDNMMHEVAKNMLNEVQCPCYAERGPGYSGYEQLQCVDSYNNLVNVMGCCNDDQAGGADNPLHATCNGAGCGALMGSTGCWGGRATDRDGNLRGDQELTKQIQTVGGCTDDAECQSPSEPHGCCEGGVCTTCGGRQEPSIDNMMHEATKNILNEYALDPINEISWSWLPWNWNSEKCRFQRKQRRREKDGTYEENIEPSIDNMMYEAATNVFCEQEGQDDGEVMDFEITSIGENGERGETTNVDINHEAIKGLDFINATQVKQLTKGQDEKESDRLDEGIFCCWLRGGCCGWEHDLPWPHQGRGPQGNIINYTHIHVEWDGCCGNSRKGSCC